NFVGYKDATADIEHLARVTTTNGERRFYLGGLPTAETYALALLEMGMSTYASATFNSVPEFALNFYGGVRVHNTEAVQHDVKDGLTVQGRDCGPVRPPLPNLSDKDLEDLKNLIDSSGAGAEKHEPAK